MRKNLSKEEIGRAWVTQSQPRAVSSSMSFNGPIFYSYGTAIGAITKDAKGRRAYLINDGGYSGTTSMHRGIMRAAIPKTARVFIVPGWDHWVGGSILDHKRTVKVLLGDAEQYAKDAKAATRPAHAAKFAKAAKVVLAIAKRHAKAFGVKPCAE